jgi:hypothetical protein
MAPPVPAAAKTQAAREQIPIGVRFELGRIIFTLPSWQIPPKTSIPREPLNPL